MGSLIWAEIIYRFLCLSYVDGIMKQIRQDVPVVEPVPGFRGARIIKVYFLFLMKLSKVDLYRVTSVGTLPFLIMAIRCIMDMFPHR